MSKKLDPRRTYCPDCGSDDLMLYSAGPSSSPLFSVCNICEMNQTIQRQARELEDFRNRIRVIAATEFDKDLDIKKLKGEVKQQQKEIELLEKCVEFYGENSSWVSDFSTDKVAEKPMFIEIDRKDYTTFEDRKYSRALIGGRLARQTKQELERLREKSL